MKSKEGQDCRGNVTERGKALPEGPGRMSSMSDRIVVREEGGVGGDDPRPPHTYYENLQQLEEMEK